MLLSFAIWLQKTGLMRALRESDRGYETLLALHVSFIALSGAMIAMTDLRLLGLTLRNYTISEIVDQLRWPKRIGFLCVATCGFLLFGMKAEEYYLNIFFRVKVALFLAIAAHALVFRPPVYSAAAKLDSFASPTLAARLAGAASLVLWFGVVCAGRGIGYIHPPPFSHHFTDLEFSPDPARRPSASGSMLSSADRSNVITNGSQASCKQAVGNNKERWAGC